jgi:alkylation response protein AidB-like acyl-CoA dehydrogenase
MDLTYSSEQRMLADAAKAFTARDWPLSVVRELEHHETGVAQPLWKGMCALGWPALAIAEDEGGFGGDLGHLIVIAEALGGAAASSPLLHSFALGAIPLSRTESGPARQRLLSALAAGDMIAAGALLEPGGRGVWPGAATAVSSHDGWRLTGVKTMAVFATAADVLLVTAALHREGPALVALPAHSAGIGYRRLQTFDGQPTFEVSFTDVRIAADDVVATGAAAREAVAAGLAVLSVLSCAHAVGLCEGALAIATEHVSTRVQFGRPIGSFQTVANRLVDARSAIDGTRMLVHRAGWAIDTAATDAVNHVATMKVHAAATIRAVVANTHQNLGALGFTTEHDLQLYTRRLKALELSLGDKTDNLETIATALGLLLDEPKGQQWVYN